MSPQLSRMRSRWAHLRVGEMEVTGLSSVAPSFRGEVFSARPYHQFHHRAHSKPNAPVRTKIHRQVAWERTMAISGGAITAPPAVPALMIPIAVARSLVGNHSATTRVAAGKPPPSPVPSRNRLIARARKLAANAWLADASDQNTMMTTNPRREPSTSTSLPPPAYINA